MNLNIQLMIINVDSSVGRRDCDALIAIAQSLTKL